MNTMDWLELHERGFDPATLAAYDKAALEGRLVEFQQHLIDTGYRPPAGSVRRSQMQTAAGAESLRAPVTEADTPFE